MTARLLTALLVLVFAAPASAAAFEPEPGDWTSSPVRGKGARAEVSFVVEAAVTSSVEVSLRRCGRRSIDFPSVPFTGGRFSARARSRAGRARLTFKLDGSFDSSFEAHGTVRGTVRLRRGGKRVVCRLPKLAWTAELAASGDDEAAWEEEYGPDDYDPEADEEYGPEDEVFPEDEEEYLPEEDEYSEDES
jgi:hypothetical protein